MQAQSPQRLDCSCPALDGGAAGRAPAHADPTLRHFALAAFDQARIAEHEVARWRAAAAALYAALEASGHVEGQTAEGSTPPVPAVGPVDG